ncbi:MAG TPA: hypothetical protein VH302_14090 [Bryobacteraceae bacterium]|nr:hypothetical protein [Bryobacteraceae bacterium]
MNNFVRYTCVFVCLLPGLRSFAADSAVAPDASTNTALPVPKLAPEYPDKKTVILAMARDTNEEIFTQLHSFVCNEEIHRFKGWTNEETIKPIDTVQTNVSFENGTEHYSEIRQNEKVRPSLSSLSGAWSEGEFGTLLGQTQKLLHETRPMFESFTELEGIPAAIYAIDVMAAESPWVLQVGSQHGQVPFRTRIWVSQSGGQILKIERASLGLPFESGIGEIRWDVSLKQVELNGRTWLLPSTGNYVVAYKSSRREWNVMQFSNYRRYASEVAIRFE